ncbi:MAG: hypothetical protein ABIA93_00390 [Candidatus Woesearchaeota archaeon]
MKAIYTIASFSAVAALGVILNAVIGFDYWWNAPKEDHLLD